MSLYKQDPNNSKKQIPISDTHILKKVGHATTPADGIINKRPTYVICNVNGTYAFAYESGSVSTYTTGSVVQSGNAGGVKLDINPVKWKRDGGGSVGDVIFVYRRIS